MTRDGFDRVFPYDFLGLRRDIQQFGRDWFDEFVQMERTCLEIIPKQRKDHPFRTVLWSPHEEFHQPNEIFGHPEIFDDWGINDTREYVDKRDIRILLGEFLNCEFGAGRRILDGGDGTVPLLQAEIVQIHR